MEDVDVPVYPNSEYGDSALPYTQFTLGFEERVATFESNSARVVVSVHKSEFAATTPMETNDAWYDAVLPDHIFSLLRETREAGEGCESVSVSRRRRREDALPGSESTSQAEGAAIGRDAFISTRCSCSWSD
jgi:hypothetical protein